MVERRSRGHRQHLSVSRHGNPGQSNLLGGHRPGSSPTPSSGRWSWRATAFRVGANRARFVRTPILDAMRPEVLEKTVGMSRCAAFGEPGEILAGVRFIIECEYFTGRCLESTAGWCS